MHDQASDHPRRSSFPRLGSWVRAVPNVSAAIGLVIIVGFAFLAIFAEVIAPTGPFAIDAEPMLSPRLEHLMGTDNLGRDVFSQFAFATRVTLLMALAAVLLSTAVGVSVGLVAGYYGGGADEWLMRVTEFFQVLPRFLLAIVLTAFAGASVWNLVLIIGGLSWPMMARVVRAEVLSLREFEFVEAARAVGARDSHIMVREILPNATPSIVVNASLEVSQAILLIAGLSFIGLGDPSQISWGTILYAAQPFLRSAWWLAVFPGVGIAMTVWALNTWGDALNEALNPRSEAR